MKMQISLSMPRRTVHKYGDFITVLENPVSNKERTAKLEQISHVRTILEQEFLIGHMRGGDISHISVENHLTQLWSLVRTERNNILKRDVLVEQGVWSNRLNHKMRGLVRDLYLKYYVPNFQLLMSSEEHYPDGENMWLKLCVQAKVLGYNVYSVGDSVTEITDIHNIREQVWGDAESYEKNRILITDRHIENISRIPNFSAVSCSVYSPDFPIDTYESLLTKQGEA